MKHRISQIDGLDDCTEDEVTAKFIEEEDIPQVDGATDSEAKEELKEKLIEDNFKVKETQTDEYLKVDKKDGLKKKSDQVSELEKIKETLDYYITILDPETLKNQPAKEISDLKVAVSNILKKHLRC